MTTELWDRVQQTDPKYTKRFKRAGGFQGTAVNPTYLARRATEEWGPIGQGWGVEVAHEEFVELPTTEVLHKLLVRLWYLSDMEASGTNPSSRLAKHVAKRCEVYQYGQTMMAAMTRDGVLRVDEEAPKKSLTDGMVKCLSLLGFSADIHLGMYDDNKYVSGLAAASEEEGKKQGLAEAITKHQKTIETIKRELGRFIDDGGRFDKDTGTLTMSGVGIGLYEAAEAWFELDNEEKQTIWVAPSTGGPFTTEERNIMKTREFREAYFGGNDDGGEQEG